MKILALSGSLRAASLNSALLRVFARLAPADISIQQFDGMAHLPLFNPDLENLNLPPVAALREAIRDADVLLIASPEYAHGITGVMKNALDWMVSCEVFVNKPVVILNASPRATHADASLREIITMMSGDIIAEASITLAIVGARLDEEGMLAHPGIAAQVRGALAAMQAHLALAMPSK
ncbi:NADPH-dependent FMN reductase [Undibacterium sp.]|uniref:NADPH-dependent FMN reductase n=1 Tax=Undibacterium sp. TaxID=1914977 RepID=UPI0025FC09BE|nr:NADPH-dependent FMN reductase [Undibacterium sp.]